MPRAATYKRVRLTSAPHEATLDAAAFFLACKPYTNKKVVK